MEQIHQIPAGRLPVGPVETEENSEPGGRTIGGDEKARHVFPFSRAEPDAMLRQLDPGGKARRTASDYDRFIQFVIH